MTTIRIPAPKTNEEVDEMRDITVKDLIATLQTYPEDFIVFPVGISRFAAGAELIVAKDADTEGVVAYTVNHDGVNLVDFMDHGK